MFLKSAIKELATRPERALRLFSDIPEKVVYVGEATDWVVKRIGDEISAVTSRQGLPLGRETTALFFRGKILHFGSLYNLVNGLSSGVINPSNIVLGNVYHGDLNGSDRGLAQALRVVVENKDKIRKIVLSTSIMEKRFLSWGVESERLVRIPIGYDAASFQPISSDKKKALREKYKIPADVVLIGSFQKDGNDWGEGDQPKLIKGPDLFIEAVKKINASIKVACLLTGPSRGYVKKRLLEEKIPFVHELKASARDLSDLYGMLDLYLVSSREEGGPIALMESMACSIPLVSTPVGMAVDIIQNGENAMLTSTVDSNEIAESALKILGDSDLRKRLSANGPGSIRHLGWDKVSLQYLSLYRSLLDSFAGVPA